jgi:hypothetical protein
MRRTYIRCWTVPALLAAMAVGTAHAQLRTVDNAFVSAYGNAAKTVLSDAPPAFLILRDKIVLYRGGNRQEGSLVPKLFAELKTVSHVALALFAILSPGAGGPLSAEQRADLQRFQQLIPRARAAIQQVGLTAEQLQRQERILAAALAVANQALAAGRFAEAELTAFCRTMRPLLDANVAAAVRAYLDELNRQMTTLLAQLTPAERGTFLAIVTGVHQARMDNATMQYFERLLGAPPALEQRVIYAENVSDEAGALHLLGIHVMARRVGTAFFDDPYYMNRDLFAPAASEYIPKMRLPPPK